MKQRHCEKSSNDNVSIPMKKWVDDVDFFKLDTFDIPSPKLYTIDNCISFNSSGLTITSDGRVVADLTSQPEVLHPRILIAISKIIFNKGFGWCFTNLKRENIVEETESVDFDIERACPLLPLWMNYYHWTAECLPRLYCIEKLYEDTGKVTTILIPPDPPSWITESLSLLANDSYVVKEFSDDSYIINEVVASTYPTPSPVACQWLRESAIDRSSKEIDSSDRIYVSREQANKRRLANFDEIQDTMNEFGFKSYILENLSVKEQVQLFSNAEIVVSPHGAGLVNMIYSNDMTVIELFGGQKKTTFYRLAKILGHNYHYMTGESKMADISVDGEQFRKIVENVTQSM
jgi:hypothetical protein